jgi:hypothetical protein
LFDREILEHRFEDEVALRKFFDVRNGLALAGGTFGETVCLELSDNAFHDARQALALFFVRFEDFYILAGGAAHGEDGGAHEARADDADLFDHWLFRSLVNFSREGWRKAV